LGANPSVFLKHIPASTAKDYFIMASTADKASQLSVLKDKLEVSERGRFRSLESIVAEGKTYFIAVGDALKEIRDSRLYREDYKTFDKYVEQKWGFKKSRAYQLIDASEVSTKLSNIVGENSRVTEINNPRQLCELKGVSEETLPAVMGRAGEIAGDDKITAGDIKQAREEILEQAEPELVYEDVDDEEEISPLLKKPAKTVKEKKPKETPPAWPMLSTAYQLGSEALDKLEQIDISDQDRFSVLWKVRSWIDRQLNAERGTK